MGKGKPAVGSPHYAIVRRLKAEAWGKVRLRRLCDRAKILDMRFEINLLVEARGNWQ
jgi:hypothetical protein